MRKKPAFVERPCPLCASRDESHVFAESDIDWDRLDAFAFASRKLPENMHFRLVLCPTCGVLYSNPILPPKAISKAYLEAAFDSGEEAAYAAKTYAGLLPYLRKKLPDLEGALDIGTGDGAFLGELKGRGFKDIVGVEPSLAPIRAAQKGIRPLIRHGLFKPGDFKKGGLSLVTCFQTFEHLLEPMEMCHGAYRILKDGGALYTVMHNRLSLSAKVLGFKSPIFDIEHMQLFSPESARYMMEKAGFKGVETKVLYNTYPLHYWVKMLPMPLATKKFLIGSLKKIGLGFLPVPMPAGNMAVIGYKRTRS